jgi:hypothetical protein
LDKGFHEVWAEQMPTPFFYMIRQKYFYLIFLLFISGCVRNAPLVRGEQPAKFINPTSTRVPKNELAIPTVIPENKISQPINKSLFNSAEVIETGYVEGQVFTVVIEFNDRLEGKFRATFDQENYDCIQQDIFPNRLYCSGKPVNGKESGEFILYPQNGNDVLFRTEVAIPKE